MKPVVVGLAVTLTLQSLTSMAMIAPAVLAPVAAPDLGFAPQTIGLLMSIGYFAAMISGLLTGAFVARFGPLAICQGAVVLAGFGLALGKFAPAFLIPVIGLLIGFGYGFVNPVSSHILARRAPPERMALVFSIKQTGVPIGGAIAGAAVPALVLALGWSDALLVLGAVCIAAAFILLPARKELAERGRASARYASRMGGVLAGPVRLVLAERSLRELAFASLGYSAVQLVFVTYFVSFLNLALGYSLVSAGFVYAFGHGAGIVGRIAWGTVADRWLAPRYTLALIGVISAACALIVAVSSASWPLAAMIAVTIVFGASAVGWNGVFLAEVARRAGPGQVGTVTGATQVFTFAGALAGPPLFAGAVSVTGSYAWAFALFALPLALGVRLGVARKDAKGKSPGRDEARS
jgi:MFS family permease